MAFVYTQPTAHNGTTKNQPQLKRIMLHALTFLFQQQATERMSPRTDDSKKTIRNAFWQPATYFCSYGCSHRTAGSIWRLE